MAFDPDDRTNVEVSAILKHETDRAWLIEPEPDKTCWIPFSQAVVTRRTMGRDRAGQPTQVIVLLVASWLAAQEGLDE